MSEIPDCIRDRKNIFILCANNSGSSLLVTCIQRCERVAGLAREGKDLRKYKGPKLNRKSCRDWANRKKIANPKNYDWEHNRELWAESFAENTHAIANVEKSPPHLMVAGLLNEYFPNACFILGVRNPYAAAIGAVQRSPRLKLRGAANHFLAVMHKQRENQKTFKRKSVTVRYEDVCEQPRETADRIISFIGDAVADLSFYNPHPSRDIMAGGLRNMNTGRLAEMTPRTVDELNWAFGRDPGVLEHFGYKLLDPTKATGSG